MIHFNAQGLLEGQHFEQICFFTKDLQADVIAIIESWLNKSHKNGLVNINDFQIFRSDRNFKNKNVKKGGGGVCTYIRKGIKAKCIEKSNGSKFTLIDYLILDIQSRNIKILFCNLYRHGNCPDIETDNVFNRINELSIDYEHVIVCGDINANSFDKNKHSKLHILTDYMHLMNDSCATYIAGNFNPSQLDLMFTKEMGDVKQYGHFSAIGISNHQAIYGILNTFTTKKIPTMYKIRNFKNIDNNEIKTFTESINWSFFSYNNEIDMSL